MAPRERSRHDRHHHRRHRKVHFKDKHKSDRDRRLAVKPHNSGTKIHKTHNYENLILYYLTKLRKLFSNNSTPSLHHPTHGCRENSAVKLKREQEPVVKSSEHRIDPHPEKYTSSNQPKPRGDKVYQDNYIEDKDLKDKVYNVVSAAIEYGYANQVLEKKGDYFVLKGRRNSKLANRQQTPGPRGHPKRYCSKCSCNYCKSVIPDRRSPKCSHRPSTAGVSLKKSSSRTHADSEKKLCASPKRSYDSMSRSNKTKSDCSCKRCEAKWH